jgi:hypothetical protein
MRTARDERPRRGPCEWQRLADDAASTLDHPCRRPTILSSRQDRVWPSVRRSELALPTFERAGPPKSASSTRLRTISGLHSSGCGRRFGVLEEWKDLIRRVHLKLKTGPQVGDELRQCCNRPVLFDAVDIRCSSSAVMMPSMATYQSCDDEWWLRRIACQLIALAPVSQSIVRPAIDDFVASLQAPVRPTRGTASSGMR